VNKENLKGIKSVFTFTFTQYVKAKAFKISCLILCALALVSFPVISLFTGEEKEITELEYKKVILVGLSENWESSVKDACAEDELLKHISFETGDKTWEEYENVLKEAEEADYVCLKYDETIQLMTVMYGKNTEISGKDTEYLVNYLSENGIKIAAGAYGIEDTQLGAFTTEISYEVLVADTEGDNLWGTEDEEKDNHGEAKFAVSYGFTMIIMLFVIFASEAVAMSIITEKSSKVVEYLMVSVRPMAIVCGKVVAVLCSVGVQMLSIGACFVASMMINGMMFPNEDGSFAMPEILKMIFNTELFGGITVVRILLAVLVTALGLIGYGLLAGVAGATVSKVEEAAEGLKIFTFSVLIGVYLVYAYMLTVNTGGDWGVWTYIPYLLPLSSPFIIPVYLLMGEVSISTGLLAAAILLITVWFLVMFIAKIYEYLIYHSGEPVKLKQLINMAKEKKTGKNK